MTRFARLLALLAAAALVPACDGDTITVEHIPPPQNPASGTILFVTPTHFLVNVHPGTPGTALSILPLSGIVAGDGIVGLDFRPSDGALFGFSNDGWTYRIDPATGVAVLEGAVPITPSGGTLFGWDFDAATDVPRLVDDTDLNTRINEDTGVPVAFDAVLAFAGGDPNNGVDPTITALASVTPAGGATTVYGINSLTGDLVTLSPAVAGTLNTVGSLGVASFTLADMDFSGTGVAYAALRFNTETTLHTIDVTTGAATPLGPLGSGGPVSGMAFVP